MGTKRKFPWQWRGKSLPKKYSHGHRHSNISQMIEQAKARILLGDSIEYAARRVGIDLDTLLRKLDLSESDKSKNAT